MKRDELISLLQKIKNVLFDIQNSLSRERFFDGGFTLGELSTLIKNKIVELNDYEIGDDDFDDEYCEEEEEEEKEDLADLYEECKKNYEELWEIHIQSSRKITELKSIIKDLIRKDHIFKSSLDETIVKLSNLCEEESKEYLYSTLPGYRQVYT